MGIPENIKALVSSIRKYKDPDLMEQVINLQTTVLELYERVQTLEKENEVLKNKLAIQGSIVLEHGVYFTKIEDKKDGPFCTRCWDVDSKLVRLKVKKTGFAVCLECKAGFDYKF